MQNEGYTIIIKVLILYVWRVALWILRSSRQKA